MAAVRVRLHLGPQPGAGILGMVGYSVAGHIIFLILTVFLPRVIPRHPPPPVLLTASIVSMSDAGIAGATPPAPKPVRSGPTPEERADAAARKERVVTPDPPKEAPRPERKPDTSTPPPPGEKPAAKKADQKAEARKEAAKPGPVPEKPSAQEPATPSAGAAEPAAPLAEGVGLGIGGADAGGGVPSISSASFPYQYYRAALVNKIRSSWSRPLTPGLRDSLRCAVSFVIARNGTVSDAALSVSSGFPPLDDSAVRAVLDSSPLPPLPYQYSSASARAEMIFELTPD